MIERVARAGLVARALIYVALGWLAIQLAMGAPVDVDQRGVLIELIRQPMGGAAVFALGIGFASYALWRGSEVLFGVSGTDDRVIDRVASAVRFAAYGLLAVAAFSVLAGARESQSADQSQLASGAYTSALGRVLVAMIGIGFVGAAAAMLAEGWSRRFMRRFGQLSRSRRGLVVWTGVIGASARGIAFALIGVLLVSSAWNTRPEDAGGLDRVAQSLLDLPGGRFLVTLLGTGLLVFGVFALLEAMWRRVPEPHV